MGTEKKTMTEELALKEVNKWLDYKKIRSKEREEKEAQIGILVDSIVDGSLVLNEDFSLVQKLDFELENVKELVFKPRLTVAEINLKLRAIDASKAHEMLVAYASAATGKPSEIIRRLDANDYKVANAINMFFF